MTLSRFKEQVEADIYSVFLNLDEFAEYHRVEGKEIPVVMDNDALAKLAKTGDNRSHSLVEADMLLMGKVTDFPADLDPGRLLNVDGREMLVVSASRDAGLVEVTLRQNRTG